MSTAQRPELTVADVIKYWLEDRKAEVKNNTWQSYVHSTIHILGPLLVGTPTDRQRYARTGRLPANPRLIPLLGPVPVRELTTAGIRAWYKLIAAEVSSHSANSAKKFLGAALALAAEDLNIEPPRMPIRLGRGRPRTKTLILSPAQVRKLLDAAQGDKARGIYYAFPFLTGLRPSEQLALSWHDIDFAREVISVRRMQEIDGRISEFTKTAAGTRDVPIAPLLKTLLLDWKTRCPIIDARLPRVFPQLGRVGRSSSRKGRPLSYPNFLATYWRPALIANGLPIVTPHSARHAFISTLQAQGIEVGLVAKLAGHANVNVTLSHYTQAVRGGEAAVRALQDAYSR